MTTEFTIDEIPYCDDCLNFEWKMGKEVYGECRITGIVIDKSVEMIEEFPIWCPSKNNSCRSTLGNDTDL